MWIYLLGCLIFFIVVRLLRYFDKTEDSIEDQWTSIKINYLGTILSWFGVILLIITLLAYIIIETKNKKPPKWL